MKFAIDVRNLAKTYKNQVEAVKGVNFTVEDGSFFALLGPNGAGKSSILGILSSIVQKTSGEVFICGHDLDKETFLARQRIGIVPQEFNMNVFENPINILQTQGGYFGVGKKELKYRIEKYLKLMGLWEKRDSAVRTLSGGMKRRLLIARGMIHEPSILILDEPTAGVDIEIRHQIWDFMTEMNRKGLTIILTTHYLEEAENLCNRIAIINHGKIMMEFEREDLSKYLDSTTYVIEFDHPVEADFRLEGYKSELTGSNTMELVMPKDSNFNQLIRALSDTDHQISNIKTKTNQLEQLFLKLTKREEINE